MRLPTFGGKVNADDNDLARLLSERGYLALIDTELTGIGLLISIPKFVESNNLPMCFVASKYAQYIIKCSYRGINLGDPPHVMLFAVAKMLKEKYADLVTVYTKSLELKLKDKPRTALDFRYSSAWLMIEKTPQEAEMLEYIKSCFKLMAESLKYYVEFEFHVVS
jgi:hypothetical protein